MIKILLPCALLLAAPLLTPAPAQSQEMTRAIGPLLHPLFSENAVLQRDRPLTIWGWAYPKTDVTVKFGGGERILLADGEGYWSVPIRPRAAGGPYSLEVSSGKRTETRRNLMFGDVWLCSGQSNMEWELRNTNDAAAEIAAANYPAIRLMTIPKKIASRPTNYFEAGWDDLSEGAWKVCSPETVGDFSAVGYFFGRRLNRDLKVPIGLIDSSWGGTVAQAWTSKPTLQKLPEFDKPLAEMEVALSDPLSLNEKMNAWWMKETGTKAYWWKAETDATDWQSVAQPGIWEENGSPDFDGVAWFKREIDVPADWIGKDLTLSLGAIDDDEVTYWNSEEVGATKGASKSRVYNVYKTRVRPGRNVITMRVLDTGGGGGMTGPAAAMFIQQGDKKIALTGDWKFQPTNRLSELPPMPRPAINQNSPTALYNGMIAPLLGGQIKGAIWYQGEENANKAKQYQTLLPAMINNWRADFEQPIPFYIAQLANFMAPDDQPRDDNWPRLREAQSMTARDVADVGLAVITDIGEAGDIHPRNKQDVGLRLALQALKNTYGQQIQADGPTLKNVQVRGGEIALTFDNAAGLNIKGDENRVFAIAGADGKYFWAGPTIQNNVVYLSTPDVAAPQSARFGWSNNPRANLYNSAGLPASPFRTDSD